MARQGNDETFRARRRLLGGMIGGTGISAAAMLGMNTPAAAAPPHGHAPEELFSLARLRDYRSRRSSSWDRTGGNADRATVDPGQSVTVLDATGAGVVTHVWFTIASPDRMHLKNLVLRAWWDGESSPSVEAPIGDFFGLGLGEYFTYQSALLSAANMKALNAYFQMPFSSAARMTVENQGPDRVYALYSAIDYVELPSIPADLGRFHAQYRQQAPCKAVEGNGKNLDGRDNYVFLEATGRGHVVGVAQSVLQNQNGWFGEGDDMIFIDGSTLPVINGTGTEDFYNGAWDFGLKPFANQHQGAPYVIDPERIGGQYSMYRWFLEGPIAFEKSVRVTIEHGTANNRADNFFSTAYWYQTEPHSPFPSLPAPAERVPKVFAVGGANAVAPEPASE